ncbi:MAG: tRNA/rRNA methyltransferase [Pseudomonadota bacterium]
MEIVFVLVGTRHPGNLGAAARALKTMGFSRLRLVNPCEYRRDPERGQAFQMAMYSHDILDGAGVFATLADAVADCDLIVGTTAKLRHHRHSVLTPPQLKELLQDKADMVRRVALLFGPEDTGLVNEHIDACDLLTSVPLAAPQPSINLAQAVMIYSYALSELPALARHVPAAEDTSYAAAVTAIERAAGALGIGSDERVAAWLRERVPLLPARDLRMLFNLLKRD